MQFCENFSSLRNAGFPLVWVMTHEGERLCETLAATSQARIVRWDVSRGLAQLTGSAQERGQVAGGEGDPLSPVTYATKSQDAPVVLALNFHWFLRGPEIVQALANAALVLRTTGATFVIVSPVCEIPTELERLVTIIEFALPTVDDLAQLAGSLADECERRGGKKLAAASVQAVDAARGLTQFEAENAMALALATTGRFTPETIWERKADMVRRNGKLGVYRGGERFASIGGLDALKAFALRALKTRATGKARSRGVLLVGVPGAGKSTFAKALGAEVGLPTLTLSLGSLFGSLVGESEKNMDGVLGTIDAMAPVILFIDEIEKGMSGAGSSGSTTDGGTTQRVFGRFLSWLQDHESEVFVVATSNDVTALPPEFTRAGRWDKLYFVDLPCADERKAIWKIKLAEFGHATNATDPSTGIDDAGWTGAEIEACCRLAVTEGNSVAEQARDTVPLSASAAEKIDALRRWAAGRAVCATRGGRFQVRDESAKPTWGVRTTEASDIQMRC